MDKWIKIEDAVPDVGANVIAVGTWCGEIHGLREQDYMGIGKWTGSRVSIDSDTYSTKIVDVTHWMPIPPHPEN